MLVISVCFEACALQAGHIPTGSVIALLQQEPVLVLASFHNLSELRRTLELLLPQSTHA